MNTKDYRTLITRLEREHAVTPERYRLKTLLLAVSGLAYPLALLALILAACLSLVLLACGAPASLALPFIAAGLGALLLLLPLVRLHLQPAQGRHIAGNQAPKLFAIIDKIESKTRNLHIDTAVLSGEFELRIQQTPRLGMLGLPRNTLIIGLPLLQILSRKEFAALLAHEFEHIGGFKGRTSAWIYRLRLNWAQLLQTATDSPSSLTRIAWWPLRRFIPYFEAFSFVMARQSEYLADRLGGKIVGKRLMADALISQELGRRFLDEQFWPNFWTQAQTTERPAFPPHGLLRTALSAGITEGRNAAWLALALKQPSGCEDTTPCLSDRLLALDQFPELPPRSTQNAAQVLLGKALPELIKEFDAEWLKAHGKAWQARHQAFNRAHEVIALYAPCKPADLLALDQCRYGLALNELGRYEEAQQLLQLAADSPQGSAEAAMALAKILHDAGDETAIHYLEIAMHKDARLAPDATARAARFYQQLGNHDKANCYWTRLNQLQAA